MDDQSLIDVDDPIELDSAPLTVVTWMQELNKWQKQLDREMDNVIELPEME